MDNEMSQSEAMAKIWDLIRGVKSGDVDDERTTG